MSDHRGVAVNPSKVTVESSSKMKTIRDGDTASFRSSPAAKGRRLSSRAAAGARS